MLNHGVADDNVHYQHTALLTKEGEQGDPCEHCEHLGGYLDVKAGFNLDHKKL